MPDLLLFASLLEYFLRSGPFTRKVSLLTFSRCYKPLLQFNGNLQKYNKRQKKYAIRIVRKRVKDPILRQTTLLLKKF